MKKKRTFVIGDIHGGYKALLQCLERSNFDYDNDKLISLGDVADGWPDVVECFEELLKIKDFVMVLANHDFWLLDWFETGYAPYIWISQGGRNSLISYNKTSKEIESKHHAFLKKTPYYYLDDKNRIFVHAYIEDGKPLDKQDKTQMIWNRSLVRSNEPIKDYKEVYIGHTTVYSFSEKPYNHHNIWCMDTGGGWEGKLSLMNIDTKEVFQSDLVSDLYKDLKLKE